MPPSKSSAFLPSKSRPHLSDSFHTSATTSVHWKKILTTEPKPFKLSSILTSSQKSMPFFAHQPQKIANRIYANRGGNRNEASGDGFLYRGRGTIQLTFHDNYWHCGQALGQDFVKNPDLVKTPMYAAMSGGWFWATHGCNQIAESGDEQALCRRINGGLFGLEERKDLTAKALAVLSA